MSVGVRYFGVRSTLKRTEYKLVTAPVYLFFLRIMTSCDPGLRVKAIDTNQKTTSVSYLVLMFLAFLFNGVFCFSFCCLFVCSVLLKNAQIAVERCNLRTHTKRITIWFSTDDWSRKTFHNLIQSAWYRRDKVSWCPLKPKDFFGKGSASTLRQGDPWWRVQNVTSAPTLMARVNTLVWVYTRTHETKAWQERITDLFFVLFRHGFHLFLCSTPRLL